MKATLFLIGLFLITNLPCTSGAQSVTLYTAGPDGLAQGIAKAFTEKSGTKVEVYQATSGDEAGALSRREEAQAARRCRCSGFVGRRACCSRSRTGSALHFSGGEKTTTRMG